MVQTTKKPLFSLTSKDFEMQTFTVRGPGGGGKDTSQTGVRFIHPASGAVGEGREERSQLANKKNAFRRMAESSKFKQWLKIEVARAMGRTMFKSEEQVKKEVTARVEELMRHENIVEELYDPTPTNKTN